MAVWEDNPAAFQAIGLGLARAQVPKTAIAGLSFLRDLQTSPHYAHIFTGYGR